MRNKFGIGLLSMAVAGLVGCADKLTDEVVQSSGDIGGETGYVTFRIKSADTGSMTRADGWLNDPDGEYDSNEGYNNSGYYSEGEGASGNFAPEGAVVENIQANRVFFFNADGTYHSSSLLNLKKVEDGTHTGSDSHTSDYPEIVYSATVKRTSDRGDEKWPTQCLVILNGRPSRLNALLAQAQAGKPVDANNGSFDMPEFLSWINKDFRDTDAAGEGLTLGLYRCLNTGDPYSTGTDSLYYFTMTNSVFFDEQNKILNATQISEDNLKPTSDEAAENPITVYVERIMSKVEVDFTGYDNAKDGETGYITESTDYGFVYSFTEKAEEESKWLGPEDDKQTTITMKALIENWTINAVEYQTKLFKELEQDWGTQAIFTGWNDISHHRSYWARDINYLWNNGNGEGTPTAKGYPTQYRAAYDGTATSYQLSPNWDWNYGKKTNEIGGNDIFDENYPWALDYKSFNAITNKKKYKYCLENTFECAEGTTYQNMIMGSHLLVRARLLTEDEANNLGTEVDGKKFELKDISDKYYYSDRYYDEDTYIKRQLAVINEVLGENIKTLNVSNMKMWKTDSDASNDKFAFENILGGLWVKYTDDNGQPKYKKVVAEVGVKTPAEEDTPATYKTDCEVAARDVFVIAPAYTVKGDGKVTIALGTKDGKGEIIYGYDNENVELYYLTKNWTGEDGQPIMEKDGETNEMKQFTRNQLVSLIYEVANTADCFKNGMMYYAVPIQHHKAVGTEDGEYEIDYDDVATGDYGVVRNHWYKFTINAIAKPGVPVHDPNQPIIPNYDNKDRYIGFEVVILPWHIVDNGNVTLGGQ